MTDAQKVELVRAHAQAVVHSVKVINGMQRGSEAVAHRAEVKSATALLAALLGRKPTAAEVAAVME
jgi:hypothetical protein